MSIIPPGQDSPGIDVEDVYRTSKNILTDVAYRTVGSWHDAEDAVQEAFALAWQQRLSMGQVRDGRAMLAALTRYQALTIANRRRGRRERYAPGGAAGSEWLDWATGVRDRGDTDDGVPCLAEASREVRNALAGLTPKCREALELRALRGLSPRDAARCAGVSVNTLYGRFSRGLWVLRRVRKRMTSGPSVRASAAV